MARRPTIADLATARGFSVATVDRVLNRRLPVRTDTARRVADAAEAIGFHAAELLRRRVVEAPNRAFGFVLQKRSDAFYRALGAALTEAARGVADLNGRAAVSYVDELSPAALAERIVEVGRKSDALAIVAVDHPDVVEAVETLARRGTPVFTVLSDVGAPSRAGYAGLDNRKTGRTAAWAIARCAPGPGTVGVLVGTHRYLGQDIAEAGFRDYCRERAPGLRPLDAFVDLEDDRIARRAILDLLAREPDLVGIYLAGGGVTGMIEALREAPPKRRPAVVCNELHDATRAALADGIVDVVLSTPLDALAHRLVAAMADAAGAPNWTFERILLPAAISTSENI
ncbi:MAG: substrate-binding domain-containing protein [Hyphomicrobiales bacterium]|nr:substrate-binding domain-containing protein [Hyphomicrobiales bacterium]